MYIHMYMCNILLVYGDFVTFTPPLMSDAGSYWCRNKTNHSDIAEGVLLFKGTHNYIQLMVCSYVLEILSIMIIGILHCGNYLAKLFTVLHLFTVLCGDSTYKKSSFIQLY